MKFQNASAVGEKVMALQFQRAQSVEADSILADQCARPTWELGTQWSEVQSRRNAPILSQSWRSPYK